MLVQDYLRGGGDVLGLAEQYAIECKVHSRYPELYMFKYDQISSPFREPIVRECRGVILDQSRNWNVVSLPFYKFFNYGDQLAAPIDWEYAKVEEKVDGSLMTMYFYDDMWHVASSGMPDAGGNVNGWDLGPGWHPSHATFNKLFWDTFSKGRDIKEAICCFGDDGTRRTSFLLPPNGCEDLCFMFELTSKYNRVVVQHIDSRLTLLAVRNRLTGEYQPHENWAHYYPTVRRFPLRDLEEVQAALKGQSGLVQEGFVIVNPDGSRVKMKNDDYVRFHHMRDSINGSPKAMLEIVRANESTEFLAHFPEWQEDYDRVKKAYEELVTELEASYEKIRYSLVQKDFALEAIKSRCSGALFSVRNSKSKDVRHHLAGISIKNLMEILNLKGEQNDT